MLKHWRLARPDVVAHDFGGCTALRAHLLPGVRASLAQLDLSGDAGALGSLPAYIGGAAFRLLAVDVMQLYVEPCSVRPDRLRSIGRSRRWSLRSVSQGGHPVQDDAPEDISAALLTDLGQLAGFAL